MTTEGTDSVDRGNPTKNVLDLFEAGSRRQDDLRAKDREISDIQHLHQQAVTALQADHNTAIAKLREEYQEKIQHAESGRLDSIRQVDREEVAKTAVAANNAITLLASQTTELASTLDKKVSDTAAAQEARNSTQYSDTNKRLSALELSSSEGKGKQTVVDPQMDKLTALVEVLARNQATGTGKGEGINLAWVVLLGVVSLIVGVITIGGFVFLGSRTSAAAATAPQVIYVPSPPGTMLPTTPPAAAPR